MLRSSASGPLGRRQLLRMLGASGLISALPSCGYYPPENGAAYTPWRFPDGETRPAYRVAQAGLLAANPHNTQPWLFEIHDDRVALWADQGRNVGSIDSQRRELYIGLGCALENMRLAAKQAGRPGTLTLFPDPTQPTLVAELVLGEAEPEEEPLFAAIPRRHTQRGRYAEVAAPAMLEPALRDLIEDDGVVLTWFGAASQRTAMRKAIVAATRAIIADDEMSRDSYAWYRHSEQEIARHRDGVTLDATGRGALTRSVGKVLQKPSRASVDSYWLDATEHDQATGSAYVLLSGAALESPELDERAAQLRVGMSYQRMHLWATVHKLGMQPQNQLLECRDREESAGLAPRFGDQLHELAPDAARAQMLFRIGYPWDDAFESPRRPLAWVEI
jgi:hypothetical protein